VRRRAGALVLTALAQASFAFAENKQLTVGADRSRGAAGAGYDPGAAATAASFNEAFAKVQGKDNVFVAGEALGSISFTAQGH
jgi:hypothetical protein